MIGSFSNVRAHFASRWTELMQHGFTTLAFTATAMSDDDGA